ncbi:hypothetical protein SNE25_15465 [Mucilaginibacter sabulilitoris]|uniref:Uncharacterized protein n=1 Tax=Mucilaginibacter sabulilitoris TaxID=1173583 RepID=A0ABZ0TYN2_9SPHI|nr:hypothetical protein [Mucilaginibacter sabulilitoris]WPU96919.1 hypothetical protein SNE25_15465 [Mucilaginibacter sabulilitoris]
MKKKLLITGGGGTPVDTAFQPYYEKLFTSVSECVGRVKNRKKDIDFTLQSPVQARDFRIIK